MSDGKVFTDKTKDLIVKVIDDAIKLGPVLELIDGVMIRGAVNIVDYYGDKVIPDDYDLEINEICELGLNEQYDAAAGKAGSLMNKLIDIPGMDEGTEDFVFVNGMKFLVSLILNWLKKKKEDAS